MVLKNTLLTWRLFPESDAAKKLQEHTDGNLKDLKAFRKLSLFSNSHHYSPYSYL
jgi:hypothetical protein